MFGTCVTYGGQGDGCSVNLEVSRRQNQRNALGQVEIKLINSYQFWFYQAIQLHPENGDGISPRNVGETSQLLATVCPRTFLLKTGLKIVKFREENLKNFASNTKLP